MLIVSFGYSYVCEMLVIDHENSTSYTDGYFAAIGPGIRYTHRGEHQLGVRLLAAYVHARRRI